MYYNIILHICYNDLSLGRKARIMILLPAGQRDFTLIWTVHTRTGVHPGSCSLTTLCIASSRIQLYLHSLYAFMGLNYYMYFFINMKDRQVLW